MKFREFQDAFGVCEFPDALFYQFEWALRFDLSDIETASGGRHLDRFIDALQRAKTITHECLGGSLEVSVFFSRFGPKNPVPGTTRAISQLEELGFDSGRLSYAGAVKQNGDDWISDEYRHWYSCKLTEEASEIDKLIWNCVAEDMGIQPYAEWTDIYFVDFDAKLIVHIYDDRGMDVVAMSKNTIQPLYKMFDKWLLDYDRSAMDKKFG